MLFSLLRKLHVFFIWVQEGSRGIKALPEGKAKNYNFSLIKDHSPALGYWALVTSAQWDFRTAVDW